MPPGSVSSFRSNLEQVALLEVPGQEVDLFQGPLSMKGLMSFHKKRVQKQGLPQPLAIIVLQDLKGLKTGLEGGVPQRVPVKSSSTMSCS